MKTGFYETLCPAFSPFYGRSIRPENFTKESLNQVNESAIQCYWKWAVTIPTGSAAIYFGLENPFKYICAYCITICAWIAFTDGKQVLSAVSQCEDEYLNSLQTSLSQDVSPSYSLDLDIP